MDKIKLIKKVIIKMLEVNTANLTLHKTFVEKQEEKDGLDHLIENTNHAIEVVKNVKHEDILVSIYNTFMAGKDTYFVMLSQNIVKNVEKWDMSEEGYQEFKKLDEEAREQFKKEQEEKKKQQEVIEQAKKEGKKIEYIYKDGKMIPSIVEPKKN